MSKPIDLDGLRRFKTKQDALNAEKVLQNENFVDGDGIIKSEKLPADFGNKIILMHVVTTGTGETATIKYFADNDGVASSTEIVGEVGKIYIDLDSGSKNIYVFDKVSGTFINFAANVASDSDIDSLFE